ncbi:hypothetical protein FM106_31430 [Brachybacterium faecium]|nr:hypothetical protein FM106_31430 [Brachybacterium faecium]
MITFGYLSNVRRLFQIVRNTAMYLMNKGIISFKIKMIK